MGSQYTNKQITSFPAKEEYRMKDPTKNYMSQAATSIKSKKDMLDNEMEGMYEKNSKDVSSIGRANISGGLKSRQNFFPFPLNDVDMKRSKDKPASIKLGIIDGFEVKDEYKASAFNLNSAKQSLDLMFPNSNDVSGLKNVKKGAREEEMQSILSRKHTESSMFETL